MSEFKQYRRSQIAELRPYVVGENLSDRVSISASDTEAGSPKVGDMIARNPKSHDDQWLVAAQYFSDNFEPIGTPASITDEAVMQRMGIVLRASGMNADDYRDFLKNDSRVEKTLAAMRAAMERKT